MLVWTSYFVVACKLLVPLLGRESDSLGRGRLCSLPLVNQTIQCKPLPPLSFLPSAEASRCLHRRLTSRTCEGRMVLPAAAATARAELRTRPWRGRGSGRRCCGGGIRGSRAQSVWRRYVPVPHQRGQSNCGKIIVCVDYTVVFFCFLGDSFYGMAPAELKGLPSRAPETLHAFTPPSSQVKNAVIGKADRILAASRAPASPAPHDQTPAAVAAQVRGGISMLARHSKSSPTLLPPDGDPSPALAPAAGAPAAGSDRSASAVTGEVEGQHAPAGRNVPPLRLAALRGADPHAAAAADSGQQHAATQRGSSPRGPAVAPSGSLSDRGPLPITHGHGPGAAAGAAVISARAGGWGRGEGAGDVTGGGGLGADGEGRAAGRVDRRAKIEELRGRVNSVWEALQVSLPAGTWGEESECLADDPTTA
jgi:hypothetical protein